MANQEQRAKFVGQVRRGLGTLTGKRIGVLGLSFKEETDDVRESPAIAIVRELVRQGAVVCAHDPVAMERAREALEADHISFAHDEYDAACGCDALLILTPWRQFARLDLQKLRSVMRTPVIFDGRNLYPPEEMAAAGFAYHSVGRVSRRPNEPVTALAGMARAHAGCKSPECGNAGRTRSEVATGDDKMNRLLSQR